MLKILLAAILFYVSCADCDSNQQSKSDVSENTAQIIHIDPTPTIRKAESSKQAHGKFSPIQLGISYQSTGSVSFMCYKSGLCLVKDTRSIKVQSGINEIEFDKLCSGLIYESLNLRTPKRGKITVLNYTFNKKDISRYSLFLSSVGNEIYYTLSDSKMEKGKLLGISKEENEFYAVINSDSRCFSIPLSRCMAINEKDLQIGSNSLKVLFDASEQDDIDLQISYLIDSIRWKHICLVEVFEKLDRVDISSQALLQNNTDLDFDNISVTFNSSSPNMSADNYNLNTSELESENQESHLYNRNLTIKKNSQVMCILKSVKSLKPILEHIVKIPLTSIESSLSKEIDLPVMNLLTIENTKSSGIDVNFHDSEALIFRRINGERSFVGKQALSSIKSGDNFVFEIGNAPDIIATVQQTDVKKLSERSVEYGVRVFLKNNKMTDVSTLVLVDIDTSWHITKRNFEMQKSEKPLWRLELKPNEVKELHFRVRMNRR